MRAARSKDYPAPLILNRDGCHVWKPESFPADDPRHGWTWDHCWQDAVALLGSEEAVREYIAGQPVQPDPTGANTTETPFRLKSPQQQGQPKLF